MQYYKTLNSDGTVFSIGTDCGGIEITQGEYNELLSAILADIEERAGTEPVTDEISASEALSIIMGVTA